MKGRKKNRPAKQILLIGTSLTIIIVLSLIVGISLIGQTVIENPPDDETTTTETTPTTTTDPTTPTTTTVVPDDSNIFIVGIIIAGGVLAATIIITLWRNKPTHKKGKR